MDVWEPSRPMLEHPHQASRKGPTLTIVTELDGTDSSGPSDADDVVSDRRIPNRSVIIAVGVLVMLTVVGVWAPAGQEFVLIILSVGAILKLVNLGRSVIWAARHGVEYAAKVESNNPMTTDKRMGLMLDSGHFLPFGAKSWRIWTWGRKHPISYGVARILYENTPLFTSWVGIALVMVSIPERSSSKLLGWLSAELSLCIAIYSLGLVLEAILWYLMVKDYALVWGSIKFPRTSGGLSDRTRAFEDVVTLGGLMVVAVASMTVGIASTQRYFPRAFENLDVGTGGLSQLAVLVDSLYYVLANLTTIGDSSISPLSSLARAQASLVMIMVIVFGAFVASAIASRIADRR